MAGTLTKEGAAWLLERGLNYTSGEDQICRLYTNDYTPTVDSGIGDFAECEATGYEEQEMTGTEWTIEEGDTSGASGEYPQLTFAIDEADDVYGYYVVDSGGTKVLWAERFPSAPYEIVSAGEIRVTPEITLDQCA